MSFPDPVISVAIEPDNRAEEHKLETALGKLAREDPSFHVHVNDETGQTIISGMGELHLEVIVDRIRREFRVNAQIGKPQVAYRETITKPSQVDYKFAKQTGGRGQFARIKLRIEPGEAGSGLAFETNIKGGNIPREYLGAVEKGVNDAMTSGVVAGYAMVDLAVDVYDGASHDVDSSEMAFRTCASMAMREAVRKASPILLEPIFEIEVVTPEEYMGDVIGDLSSRRGRVTNLDERGGARIISGVVPLGETFGYATDLRSMTQGRATYTLQFAHYAAAPQAVKDVMIRKAS
jgi:elongation factor G